MLAVVSGKPEGISSVPSENAFFPVRCFNADRLRRIAAAVCDYRRVKPGREA